MWEERTDDSEFEGQGVRWGLQRKGASGVHAQSVVVHRSRTQWAGDDVMDMTGAVE